MDPLATPDPFHEAMNHALQRAVQVASSVVTGAQVLVTENNGCIQDKNLQGLGGAALLLQGLTNDGNSGNVQLTNNSFSSGGSENILASSLC